ncbi:protein of unknown function (plasmid) [Cupriavidus taiwanensis]|uniref:Uncharacterized protein n=1 Tax=Cupriavidus taiwanensis TaxID=164546 RepID=A0A375IQE9_9BURK|nr:hypothetical protein CBM2588_B10260 [Cupriavidus taiwanensis]SOY60003.1 hypothetical protein CBM2592_B10267 [Cupriavidus taiwanensis]SOY92111.1 hypothetical protein CBM2591_B10265 [Cupriavidus taiwanensis]SOZ83590.1 hypothetical protein CBM2618_B10264 [Cupriavidus taiwanensis]SOZ86209.1 hypothetical protein CBM2622_B10263 [Cupriavidus taiwanensis]
MPPCSSSSSITSRATDRPARAQDKSRWQGGPRAALFIAVMARSAVRAMLLRTRFCARPMLRGRGSVPDSACRPGLPIHGYP